MIYFTVHDLEEKHFILRLTDGLAAREYSRLNNLVINFPEAKWSVKHNGYLISKTSQNMLYLLNIPLEYETDEMTQLVIEKSQKTELAQRAKERIRLTYRDTGIIPSLPYTGALPPFNHQAVGLHSVHLSEYFALLMEMGTGKTKIMIDEICWVGKGKIVIVCPKAVIGQWIKEFKKHATLPYYLCRLRSHHKGVGQLVDGLRAEEAIKIWLVNYDKLPTMVEFLSRLQPDITILDESHSIKNRNAKRTKAAFKLGAASARRFILTGTPVANTLMDLYAQYHFLQPGSLGYENYNRFRNHFARFKKSFLGFDQLIGYRCVDELRAVLSKTSFTVKLKDCADIPESIYQIRYITMTDKQRSIYEQMLTIALADIEGNLTPSGTAQASIVLVQLLKLAQICNGFLKTIDNTIRDLDNPKIDEVKEWIEEIPQGTKAVIWARFHKDVDALRALFTRLGKPYAELHGRVPDNMRQHMVDSFNSDEGPDILIGEPGSGGVGIELVGTPEHPCSNVGYYSNDFSALKRAQSEARSHRITTRCVVVYTDFICEDSIEERIQKILVEKRELNESIKDFRALLTGEGFNGSTKNARDCSTVV